MNTRWARHSSIGLDKMIGKINRYFHNRSVRYRSFIHRHNIIRLPVVRPLYHFIDMCVRLKTCAVKLYSITNLDNLL